MADTDSTQQKKWLPTVVRIRPALVPPPPPVIAMPAAPPQVPANPYLQPAAQPAAAPVASPRPVMPAPLPSPSAAMDPDYLKGLQDSAKVQQALADKAQTSLDAFSPLSLPAQQPSAFEQMLDQGLQRRMVDLLTGKESRAERFSRGYDLGQKVAANLLVPLMGAMSHKAGTAIGAAEATNALRQQSMENERMRSAERQARNSTLMNLANLYENMSPSSAKNLMAMAQQKLALLQANNQERNRLLQQAIAAQQSSTAAQHEILQARLSASKEDWDRATQKHVADREDATALSQMQDRNFEQGVKSKQLDNETTRIQQEDQRLRNEGTRLDNDKKKFDYEKGKDAKEFNFKQQDQEFKALSALNNRDYALTKALGERNMLGQPKNPDLLERLGSNPSFMAETQALIDKAGLNKHGISAQGVIDGLRKRQELQEAAGIPSSDVLGIPYSGPVLKAMQGIMDTSAPADREALPSKPAASTTEPLAPAAKAQPILTKAYDEFVKKNGRPPSAKELHALVNGGSK